MAHHGPSAESPAEPVIPLRADKAKAVSVAMLVIGVILLWPVPLGGALCLATAGLGLTMAEDTR
ncbi:MAG: hypothetical protein QOJ23_4517 [Actinomycetota bacterium]|jgi:hypothetical protein|nr:hypothetical protein [Actinomycetota bacterium]MDQ1500089.1 hypothetical protein [Actinomycetota bacterium]